MTVVTNETAQPATISRGGRLAHPLIGVYLAVTGAVLLLMMLAGLLMRAAQAGYVSIPADIFYQVMTAHGIGMVGIAGLAGSAIMWHFLSAHVRLTPMILGANLVLFLLGVVMILSAIFLGGFAGAWTFLYPLPSLSGGAWGTGAAALHLGGLLAVGTGFLLFYLDAGWALIRKYGGLGRALGWPHLFGGEAEAPPPAVVASAMVVIVNTLGLVSGASVLAISLVNALLPSFAIDPLLAKNMIFFFGHVFINATIYMAVIAVYELLPRYTGRPWKSNRVFLAAWTAATVMVVIVYPHHLLMDFAMPTWAMVLGQVISYTSGIPVLCVTAFGALVNVHRSGIKWDAASALLFLSMFGWAGGVVPAIIDATIVVNYVMHNTVWVPGHFHFYLLLGMAAMVFGFMSWLAKEEGAQGSGLDRLAVWLYAGGGLGFVFAFLAAGKDGVPRRWAVHMPEWMPYDRMGTLFASLLIVGVLVLLARFLGAVPRLLAAK
jgi:cytochrome c oxidase subunit 1